MTEEKDIFGNLLNTDVQGNPQDNDVFGERPKDAFGNKPKDLFGNESET